jgi:hypothetical protein
VKLHIHAVDHQQSATFFDIAVGDARSPEHLDASTLKVIQVLSVVNSALTVDFVIVDSDRDLMLLDHKIGSKMDSPTR